MKLYVRDMRNLDYWPGPTPLPSFRGGPQFNELPVYLQTYQSERSTALLPFALKGTRFVSTSVEKSQPTRV